LVGFWLVQVTAVTGGQRSALAVEFWHAPPESHVRAMAGGDADGRPTYADPVAPHFDVCPR